MIFKAGVGSERLEDDPLVGASAKEIGDTANVGYRIGERTRVGCRRPVQEQDVVADFIKDDDESPGGIGIEKLERVRGHVDEEDFLAGVLGEEFPEVGGALLRECIRPRKERRQKEKHEGVPQQHGPFKKEHEC